MAKLTTKERKKLPGKDFALGKGRYPIEDASHARNALARVAQHGSPAEKAKVRAKVHEKYPGIGEGGKHMAEKKHVAKKGDHREKKGERKGGMRKHEGEHEKHEAIGSHDGHMMKMGKHKK